MKHVNRNCGIGNLAGSIGRLTGILLLAIAFSPVRGWAGPTCTIANNLTDTLPGSGDGRIHVMPAMSAVSLKNGDRATIQAVITAEASVAGVEARIVREDGDGTPVAVFALEPAP